MKKTMKSLLATAIMAFCCAPVAQAAEDLTQYVNPNLGVTHSRWFFYTPAALPFGMAKLAPSTDGTYGNHWGWEAVGYQDDHTTIDGFPCMHEFQVGGIALMPVTGEVKTVPGKVEDSSTGFRSAFDKKSEQAHPGYYSVYLTDYRVRTELTATTHVGFQRYTFPESKASRVLFNIGNRQGESGEVVDASISCHGNIVEGFVVTKPEYVKKYQPSATIPLYFYAVLSKAPQSVEVFHQGDASLRKATSITGKGAIMSVNYNTKANEQITVKIGLSYTSVANARGNLNAEAGNMSFDKASKNAKKVWNEALGRVRVKDGNRVNKTKFYSGLFHALLGRGVASDVDGAYPKNDGSIGQIPLDGNGKPKFHHYNTDAMWGGYWNLTLLWAMAYPERYNDFLQAQLLVYKETGWLGDGIAASKYVSGVGTNMMPVVFAGAYNSGIRDFDTDLAYEACKKNELDGNGRPKGAGKQDVALFVKHGYVPFDSAAVSDGVTDKGAMFSASHTMEYCFTTYAMAQWAKQLGKDADYKLFSRLSNGWLKIFDDSLRLIRPRDYTGKFIENFNPLEPWRGFQEGNAEQYTYFVPGNPELLIDKMGRQNFNRRLNEIFTLSEKTLFSGGKSADAFSGVKTVYNHGNQPCLQEPWLFCFSDMPWLTQKWTRAICDEFYGTTGEHGYGYAQDEDQGQLGAWYVMAAMGLFDVQGGAALRPTYQIGSPMFDEVVVTLSPMNTKGKTFTIRTQKTGKKNIYVQSAKLNGKPLNNCWLYRDKLLEGGTLELVMGDEPNEQWGLGGVPF